MEYQPDDDYLALHQPKTYYVFVSGAQFKNISAHFPLK